MSTILSSDKLARSRSPALKLTQHLAWLLACSVVVAACADDDEPIAAAAAGMNGKAGSSAGSNGESGSSGTGGVGGEGGQGALTEAELEQLRDVCARVAGQKDYLYLTGRVCEDGTHLYHNMVIPPGEDEIPMSESPRSYSAHFETCMQYPVFTAFHACWQATAAYQDCLAEDVLYCDDHGYWNYSDDCGPADFAHVCTE